jgi:hypothetical protein
MVHHGGKPSAGIQFQRLFLLANNIFELPKQQHLNTHETRITETLPGTLDKFCRETSFLARGRFLVLLIYCGLESGMKLSVLAFTEVGL